MSDITREEAIERIQSIKSKVSLYYDVLALRMAEEALKNQKDITKELEQIRAEIDALDKWGQAFYRYNLALGDCIEIIDNHIEEIKGKNKWTLTN